MKNSLPDTATVRQLKDKIYEDHIDDLENEFIDIHLADGSVAPDEMTLGEVRNSYRNKQH